MPDLILELSSSGYKWGDAHTKPKECVLSVFLQGIYDSPGDCSGFPFWEGNWGSDWINMYIHKFTYITYVRFKTVLYILCNMPKSRNLMTFIHCCVKLANANKIIHIYAAYASNFWHNIWTQIWGPCLPGGGQGFSRGPGGITGLFIYDIWYILYSIFYIIYHVLYSICVYLIYDIWYNILNYDIYIYIYDILYIGY